MSNGESSKNAGRYAIFYLTLILVIDNYDSFTYNLVQLLAALGADTRVLRNDAIDVTGIRQMKPSGILISPGPGVPESAGVSLDVFRELHKEIPVLGVCLGHQALAHAFGAKVVRATRLMHGRTSQIHHDGKGVFASLPTPFRATRYHSLMVDPATLPSELIPTAWAKDAGMPEELMGIRHATFPLEGVQFHPESFLTEHGKTMLANFFSL